MAKGKGSGIDWSPFQMAVFKFLVNKEPSLVIQAVAGSGKTETVIKGVQLLASRGVENILFLAFNKKIQEHASNKLLDKGVPSDICSARTFNSMGNSMCTRRFGKVKLETKKLSLITKFYLPLFPYSKEDKERDLEDDDIELEKLSPYETRTADVSAVLDILGYIRNMGLLIDNKYDVEAYARVIRSAKSAIFDLDFDAPPIDHHIDRYAALAAGIMQRMDENVEIIDFTDQVRLPLIYNLEMPPYLRPKVVVVDEAQDLNPYQFGFIKTLVRSGARIIFVGDSSQAIYAFRGATAGSLDTLAEITDAQKLPLSITYRCPSAITDFTNAQVADRLGTHLIPHREGGEVKCYDIMKLVPESSKSDRQAFSAGAVECRVDLIVTHKINMVVSAMNQPLFSLFLELFSRGVKSNLKGTGIIPRMQIIISSIKKKTPNWKTALEKIDEFLSDSDNADYNVTKYDQISCLEYVIKTLNIDGWDRLDEVLRDIDNQDETGIQLHTIHSSKGLEAANVLVVNRWFDSVVTHVDDKTGAKKQVYQTDNLKYVAYTRASELLVIA